MGKWEMARLGDVCEIVSGTTPSTNKPELWGGNIKWITPAEISSDSYFIYDTERHISEKAGLKQMPAGTVLLSSRAPIGKVAIAAEPMCCNQGFKNLICSESIHNRYLYRYLKNQTTYLNSLGRGATFKEISKAILEDVKIPLPPLANQQKIADILDRANALIEKRKAQIGKLDLLVKSQFVEMFGDPVTNPMGWEVGRVIDFCDCMVPGRDKPKSFTGDIPWITIDDLIVNGITNKSKSNMGLTAQEVAQVKRKPVPIGSVLMSCVGNLGILSIAGTEVVINQQLHSFQCKENVINVFIMFELGWQKSYMKKMANSTTLPYMNKSVCNSIPVRVPPLALQTQFATFVERVETQKAQLKKSLALLDLNYKSLMQKCFVGEIV